MADIGGQDRRGIQGEGGNFDRKGGGKKKGDGEDSFSAGGFKAPPAFSYDPSLMAELRASQRGLVDLRTDIRLEGKYAKQDFKTDRKDIRQEAQRGKQDISRDLRRGVQDIGYRKADTRTDLRRGREDFALRMEEISRKFNSLGSNQAQGMNAAGVTGGGTAAAAQARRAENQQFAEQPLKLGQERLSEDASKNLARLGTEQRQLEGDTRLARRRLKQDTRQDLRLTKRDFRRGESDRDLRLERGIREERIAESDILKSMVFDALNRNPTGNFTKLQDKSSQFSTKKGKK